VSGGHNYTGRDGVWSCGRERSRCHPWSTERGILARLRAASPALFLFITAPIWRRCVVCLSHEHSREKRPLRVASDQNGIRKIQGEWHNKCIAPIVNNTSAGLSCHAWYVTVTWQCISLADRPANTLIERSINN